MFIYKNIMVFFSFFILSPIILSAMESPSFQNSSPSSNTSNILEFNFPYNNTNYSNPTIPLDTPTHYGLFKKRNINSNPLSYPLVEQIITTSPSETYEEVMDIIRALQDPYFSQNNDYKRFILFMGPPGNGKTTLAQAIAQKAQVFYIFEQAKFILTQYVNSGSKYLDDLGSYVAMQQQVLVVIIDEAHFLLNDQREDQSKNQDADLLTSLADMTNKIKNMLVICTSNTLNKFSTPTCNRLSFNIIEIPALTLNQRIAILRFHLAQREFTEVSDQYIQQFAKCNSNLSGREIENFVKQAAIYRTRDQSNLNPHGNQETYLNSALTKFQRIKWLYTENPNARYWQIGTTIIIGIPTAIITLKLLADAIRHFYPSKEQLHGMKMQEDTLALAKDNQQFNQQMQINEQNFQHELARKAQEIQRQAQEASQEATRAAHALQERAQESLEIFQNKSLETQTQIANIQAQATKEAAISGAVGTASVAILPKLLEIAANLPKPSPDQAGNIAAQAANALALAGPATTPADGSIIDVAKPVHALIGGTLYIGKALVTKTVAVVSAHPYVAGAIVVGGGTIMLYKYFKKE